MRITWRHRQEGYQRSDIGDQEARKSKKTITPQRGRGTRRRRGCRGSQSRKEKPKSTDRFLRHKSGQKRDGNTEVTEGRTQRAQREEGEEERGRI
jgi:hypothetical protein